MQKGLNYGLVLANSLTADGEEEFDLFRHTNQSSGNDEVMNDANNLIDTYDYVMHGKIFEDKLENDILTVFLSFGGLLMSIKGQFKDLKELEMDSRVYLCLKQIGWKRRVYGQWSIMCIDLKLLFN